MSVRAAAVTTLGAAPKCIDLTLGAPLAGQVQINVVASAVHQLVKARASGKHYSASEAAVLPMVVGVDGCGYRVDDGAPVYYITFMDKQSTGAMAARINVAQHAVLPVPPQADLKRIAALVNPAMSSWLALRTRAGPAAVQPGARVLIVGATGASGQLAIQIARALGAAQIVGVARNAQLLQSLTKAGEGLDAAVALPTDTAGEEAFTKELAKHTTHTDVVLDYLSARPAELCIQTLIAARENKQQRLDWIQIGSMAGPNITVPAMALRSANFYLSGSGIGSISPQEMKKEVVGLIDLIAQGKLTHKIVERDVSQVEQAWDAEHDGRLVITFEQ
ncbi:hypothetical protein BC940DRAFT_292362 [Gongronella butleri]|nr:hypothetical protein BC940DRAFT_292362 [Gongronella butleri]